MRIGLQLAMILSASLVFSFGKLLADDAGGGVGELRVFQPRESGTVRLSRKPDKALDVLTTAVPRANIFGQAKQSSEVIQAETPCGRSALSIALPATGQGGANGVVLEWDLPKDQQDWQAFNQLEIWFSSQKGGAIDLGAEGGIVYYDGFKVEFRDAAGNWFGGVISVRPYMGGVWQPLRLRFDGNLNSKGKPDLKRVDKIKVTLKSAMRSDLKITFADLGLKYIPTNVPSVEIQSGKTGYLISPGVVPIRLALKNMVEGRSANVVLTIRDFSGKEVYSHNLVFDGKAKPEEKEVPVTIKSQGYYDMSAELSIDGRPAWISLKGLACLEPLTAVQLEARAKSIFGIWTSYHESLGAGWMRSFLCLPKNNDNIIQGLWTPPAPPAGTLGICCVHTPFFWKNEWFDATATQTQYDEFAKGLELSAKLCAEDGRFPYYEVINEPNAHYWGPMEKLVDYHRMVSQALKQGDPKAKVGGPCTYNIDLDYIEKFLAAGGEKWIDFIVVHGYHSEQEFQDNLQGLKRLLQKRGLTDKEILITEKGEAIPSVTPEMQAALLVRAYAIAWAEGVKILMWHAYFGGIDNPDAMNNDDPEFNIVRADGSANPAFAAYGVMTRTLLGSSYDKPVEEIPQSCAGYKFINSQGRKIIVLWKRQPGVENVDLQENGASCWQDIAGGRHPIAPTKGSSMSFAVTENPIYIIW